MLADLFSSSVVTTKKKGKLVKDTVCTKFKSQLSLLMETIEKTKVQYVRCVKPNTVKSKANYDLAMVVDQLRCAGVIEAIRVARAGYAVLDGGAPVGEVTSGALSPTLGHPIAMAFVDPAVSAVGTELELDVRGSRVPATVVALPFYRRESRS